MTAPGRVRCSPSVSWGVSDPELTLFDSRDGSYHTLNASAGRIWLNLSEGRQPGEIVAAIADRHQLASDQVAPDVAAFVEQALAARLLVADDGG